MKFEKLLSKRDLLPRGSAFFILKCNIEFLCQKLNRLDKLEVLLLHYESEAIAAFAGAEAFVEAAVRMDVKGGGLLRSEWT
jgi:hypothetical protein